MSMFENQGDENALLAALKRNDPAAFRLLIQRCYPMVADFILKNRGNTEDVRDMFQQAMMKFLLNIRKPGFSLTAKISTYFFSIAKNTWWYHLRGNRLDHVDPFVLAESEKMDEFDAGWEQEYDLKDKLVAAVVPLLGADCRQVLTDFYFNRFSMAEIARHMGYESANYAKVKKGRCIEALQKLVAQHPDYEKMEKG